MLTFWLSAHKEDSASPLKPNVSTDVRSENVSNLDVWCFKAIIHVISREKNAFYNERTNAFVVILSYTTSIINNFN